MTDDVMTAVQDVLDEEDDTVFPSERLMYLLSVGMSRLVSDLNLEISLAVYPEDTLLPDGLYFFPPSTYRQPVAWWQQLADSGERLARAFRNGTWYDARSPGEEALLWIVLQHYLVPALDTVLRDRRRSKKFSSLPLRPEFDTDLTPEILPQVDVGDWYEIMIGDGDIMLVWDPAMDGVDDPESDVNKHLGLGDYRPAAWNRYFRSEIVDPSLDDE